VQPDRRSFPRAQFGRLRLSPLNRREQAGVEKVRRAIGAARADGWMVRSHPWISRLLPERREDRQSRQRLDVADVKGGRRFAIVAMPHDWQPHMRVISSFLGFNIFYHRVAKINVAGSDSDPFSEIILETDGQSHLPNCASDGPAMN
jgi:hypothetical protein